MSLVHNCSTLWVRAFWTLPLAPRLCVYVHEPMCEPTPPHSCVTLFQVTPQLLSSYDLLKLLARHQEAAAEQLEAQSYPIFLETLALVGLSV
jgi:hypothetical protein